MIADAEDRQIRGQGVPRGGVPRALVNRVSRRAIERLGAKQDGVLRKHTVFESGPIRDTVVFSITDDEWPEVRFGLRARLRRAD